VMQDPVLALEFADVIHPYAWAHARPDPFFPEGASAYNMHPDVLASFLAVQSSLKAQSPQAASLVEVQEDLSIKSSKSQRRLGLVDQLMALLKKDEPDFGVDPKGASTVMGIKPDNNAASVKVKAEPGIPSDFRSIPNAKEAMGSFPGALHYRRGQYGLRRRRLPYYSSSEGFGSVNPYRKLNSFYASPQDVMSPKAKWHVAKDPSMFDLGRFAQAENKLPYAGYSSFHSSRFRSARDAGVLSPSSDSYPGLPHAVSGSAMHHPSFRGIGAGRLSDGTPITEAPRHLAPLPRFRTSFNSPSPYIPGMTGEYFNFFGAGGGEGSESSG